MKPGLKKKMGQAVKYGLEGVNLKHSIIDEKVMANAKELGLEVLTWTVDEPEEAKRLVALGVKQITTNRPKWLRMQIAQ